MSCSLEVPCFRYFGKDLKARLIVKHGTEGNLLVRCPVRQSLYFLTPEERVRQALIWFLLEGSKGAMAWRNRLRVEVEQRSLDVAAFLTGEASDESFYPNLSVLIIETKREERESMDDPGVEEQLRLYMVRERCRAGLIVNAQQAAWLSLSGEFTQPRWVKDRLSDMCEVENRIEQASAEATAHVLDCKKAFTEAAAGDFDSLVHLVSLFGTDSGLTFVLSIRSRDSISSVQAFRLRTSSPNIVTYWTRSVESRKPQQLSKQDFHSLVAVRPL